MFLKNLKFIIPLILLVVAVGFYLTAKNPQTTGNKSKPTPTIKSQTATIGSTEIVVRVAKTAEEKSKGLSGTANLAENEGLLFEFKPKTTPNFWMKDMLIPIDIIWISDGAVIGIEKEVPAPDPGTDDARLPLYYPSGSVDYVLEVNAGFSNRNNIKAGDSVTFNLY